MTAEAPETVEIPENHGLLSTLDKSGDTRVMWDRNNKDEVSAARDTFEKLTRPKSEGGQGYLAYKAEGKRGEQGEQIRKFDKNAERIILVAPLVGG
jgi:hypothetical protein